MQTYEDAILNNQEQRDQAALLLFALENDYLDGLEAWDIEDETEQ
jgi:hypothetical protein